MGKLTRTRRTLRGIPPLALALSLLWPAAVARAAVSCSFDDAAGIVSVSFAHGDVPTVSRLGDAIAVDGVACGTATVINTDSIDIAFADDSDSDIVVIDLSGGPLAPGATDEGDGSSEIEIDVTGGDGSFDTLRIVGSSGPDAFASIPLVAVNLNAGEAVTDADVTVDATISLELIGGDGDDELSADLFSSFGREIVFGGNGDDRLSGRGLGSFDDVLDAGPGRDIADFSLGNEVHVAWLESGGLRVDSTGGEVENVEVAILTDGGDTVSYEGDAIGETWMGDNVDFVEVTDPAPLVSPEDRIIHGGRGDFDSIRFDLTPTSSAYIELSPHTLGGTWSATYRGIEFMYGSSSGDTFLISQRGTYPTILGRWGLDVLDLRFAVGRMDVTLGQDTFGDRRWIQAFEFERVFGTGFDDVFLGPGAGVENGVTFYGFGGDDFLRGGDRSDVLRGGGGADTLAGLDGADSLIGSTGDDVLRGGRGLDELRGGPGDDVLTGGAGEDACVGGPGSDRVDCER